MQENFIRLGRNIYNLHHLVQAEILDDSVTLYLADGRQIELRDEEAVVMSRVLDAEDLVEQARIAGVIFTRVLRESEPE